MRRAYAFRPALRKAHTFFIVWGGHLVSLIGSNLTKFALGIWMLEKTGSATQFALIYVFTALPSVLLGPVAGKVVDSHNRRLVMLLSDLGSGLSSVMTVLLLVAGRLEPWHVYALTLVSSAFTAFQAPAYTAAATQIVSEKQLGRAAGLTQMAQAAARIAAPFLAGMLLLVARLETIILIDIVTFLFAVATLLVRFPDLAHQTEEARKTRQGDFSEGWRFLKTSPGLLALALFGAPTGLLLGIMQVLTAPMILSFTTPQVLGALMSVSGIGMLAGSLLMSI